MLAHRTTQHSSRQAVTHHTLQPEDLSCEVAAADECSYPCADRSALHCISSNLRTCPHAATSSGNGASLMLLHLPPILPAVCHCMSTHLGVWRRQLDQQRQASAAPPCVGTIAARLARAYAALQALGKTPPPAALPHPGLHLQTSRPA